ncbi:hypothetical protein PR048_015889 [Dryococelus australis]|uniref:Uncharacterized protein n=1 Tax=Dryococelus australis TaxID=614101 RepID=A0ABQ9HIE5_9NEOP|nr:hypothetical protein PR048_015889 [Dryococelus australis]
MRNIRQYNKVTSFRSMQVVEWCFMPTFKIQVKSYHLADFLLACRSMIIHFCKSTLSLILKHKYQHDVICYRNQHTRLNVVIHTNKVPAGEHLGCYNAPSMSEVAVVIAGQQFDKRDIVLRSRNDNLQ